MLQTILKAKFFMILNNVKSSVSTSLEVPEVETEGIKDTGHFNALGKKCMFFALYEYTNLPYPLAVPETNFLTDLCNWKPYFLVLLYQVSSFFTSPSIWFFFFLYNTNTWISLVFFFQDFSCHFFLTFLSLWNGKSHLTRFFVYTLSEKQRLSSAKSHYGFNRERLLETAPTIPNHAEHKLCRRQG